MLYLVASIIFTSFIYLLFRAFGQYRIQGIAAIVINYFTAALLGWLFVGKELFTLHIQSTFILFTAGLGLMFFIVFNLLERTTELLGVAGGTILSRMSLVIPAAVSIIFFGELLTGWKIAGILLALISIFFTVYRGKNEVPEEKHSSSTADSNAVAAVQSPVFPSNPYDVPTNRHSSSLPGPNIPSNQPSPQHAPVGGDTNRRHIRNAAILIPILAFVGEGIIDSSLKIAEVKFLHNKSHEIFVAVLYTFAFLSGIVILFFRRKDLPALLHSKTLMAGALLGIINFFSIYFFVLALTNMKMDGSRLFPINSVGIVALSTILSILIFKEKINTLKAIGLFLALLAIYLVSQV